MRPPRAQLRRVAPVGGQRSAFEDGAAGPDQAGDRRDALSQGGRAVHPVSPSADHSTSYPVTSLCGAAHDAETCAAVTSGPCWTSGVAPLADHTRRRPAPAAAGATDGGREHGIEATSYSEA